MPIYEYRCESCGHRMELIQKVSDPPITQCPNCSGPMTKVLAPSALQFKGTGWYVTDYSNKGKPPKGETDSKEKTGEKSTAESKPKPSSKDKEPSG